MPTPRIYVSSESKETNSLVFYENSCSALIESISEVDIAWMAGLLEGEGSFGLDNRSKKRYKNSTSPPGVYIKISMTDEDVIEKMAKLGAEARKRKLVLPTSNDMVPPNIS